MTPEELAAAEKKKLEEKTTPTEEKGIKVTQDAPTAREKLMMQEIERQGRVNAELSANVAKLMAGPEKSETEKNKEFWENPDKRFKEMLDETVKPLNDFVGEMRRGEAYKGLKERVYASNPKLAAFAKQPGVSDYIDRIIGSSKGEVNEGVIKATIMSIRGAIEMGELTIEGVAPSNGNERTITEDKSTINRETKDDKNMTLPPHLRPSAPPPPKGGKEEEKEPDLDENERRLARENKLTPRQFKEWQEMKPLDVAHSKLGNEETKK